MPLYNYYCKKCEHSWEERNSIAERENPFKNPCPECKESGSIIIHIGHTAIADPHRLNVHGRHKPTAEFSETMKRIGRSYPNLRKGSVWQKE